MRQLKFSVIGPNIWAVQRAREGSTFKIAEVVIGQDNIPRLIPLASYALSQDEIQDISAFMDLKELRVLTLVEDLTERDATERARL